MTSHKQTTDSSDYTTGYTYSLSGQLLEQTYPSGRVVKNTYDTADGSLSQVQSEILESAILYHQYSRPDPIVGGSPGASGIMKFGNGIYVTNLLGDDPPGTERKPEDE